MSSSQLDIFALGGTQIVVGLSAIVKVNPSAYQRADTMKIVAGAGTLWICPLPGVSLTGANAGSLMTVGYPVGASEVINIGGPATFYLAAASATMTVGLALGYTSGVSMPV